MNDDDNPVVYTNLGVKIWYKKGARHRIDGPAVIASSGDQEWWMNGELHRMNGPAICLCDGSTRWYHCSYLYPAGGLIGIVMALSPLGLPPYVILWILEWMCPSVNKLNRPKLVALLEGIRNSRQRIKGDV